MTRAAQVWRETIGEFLASNPTAEADNDLLNLLERLAESYEAASAFSRLSASTDRERWKLIIVACIDAHVVARDFQSVINAEKKALTEMDRLERSIADLKGFVRTDVVEKPDELARTFRFGLQVRARYSFQDTLAMQQGLSAVALAIRDRHRTANETILRWGATRKTGGSANVTAAVGFFAESVRGICGKPHEAAAAELVSAVLQVEVTLDQLHAAEATRHRGWRME